jgi:hypothetical protein
MRTIIVACIEAEQYLFEKGRSFFSPFKLGVVLQEEEKAHNIF